MAFPHNWKLLVSVWVYTHVMTPYMNYVLCSLFLVILVMTVAGNDGIQTENVINPDYSAQERGDLIAESESNVAYLNNRFASDFYLNLSQSQENAGKNIIFSPLSISSAGAMTYEGARGKTADEIRAIFHFSENSSILREGYNRMVPKSQESNVYSVNALWAEETIHSSLNIPH
jgi:serpin B